MENIPYDGTEKRFSALVPMYLSGLIETRDLMHGVEWFRFDLGSLVGMDFDEDERRIFPLQPGDLLICEGGEPGRSAVWRGEISGRAMSNLDFRHSPSHFLAFTLQLWNVEP
jgi:hypothetical protein